MKIIKKIVKWLLILLTLVSIVIATLWLLNAPEQLSETSVSRTRLDQGDYVVEKVQLEVVDDSRPTDAVGGYEGDDKRVLKGAIWMPEGNSKGHPLVIYNHGFSGYHRDSTYLVEYLARNGYVVAAVDFPLSSAKAPSDVPQLNDVVNQPGDVSKLIDHILSMNSDSESVLYQRIDINNIGVEPFDDLLVNYVGRKNANFVIRGLRAVSDFDYEFQLASANRRLNENVETIFLTPSEANYFISSSLVREISLYDGDIQSFVPKYVEEQVIKKWAAKKALENS